MVGLDIVKNLLKKGNWMAKLDLRDAYLTVPVQRPPALFKVSVEEDRISVFVPTLRSSSSSTCLYKNLKVSNGGLAL